MDGVGGSSDLPGIARSPSLHCERTTRARNVADPRRPRIHHARRHVGGVRLRRKRAHQHRHQLLQRRPQSFGTAVWLHNGGAGDRGLRPHLPDRPVLPRIAAEADCGRPCGARHRLHFFSQAHDFWSVVPWVLITSFGMHTVLQTQTSLGMSLTTASRITQGARMKVYMSSLLFPRSWYVQVAGVRISALVLVMVGVALSAHVAAQCAGPAHHAWPLHARGGRGPGSRGGDGRERAAGSSRSLSCSARHWAVPPACWSACTTPRSTSSWATRRG